MLEYFTLTAARDGLLKKKFSAVELTQAFLKRMSKFKKLNAYITECNETAINQAKKSDELISKNEAREIEGIPLAIKDMFCTKGIKTTAGLKILSDFVPIYESTVTKNLLNSGAVFLGKTNLDEFAMGSSNLTSFFGPVISPWKRNDHPNKKLVPGGSSGGSAAAVAAHLCIGATGTDTGGSIRQPASFSGITGLKPTYGRCSRWGIVAFASSLDQAGPLTKNVQDAAILLKIMSGHDKKDSTSASVNVPDFEQAINKSIKGLKIGIPKEYHTDGMAKELHDLWNNGANWLREAGAEIIPISLPHTKYALPVYYIIAPAEASSNLARYDGVRYGFRAENPSSIYDLYEKTRSEGFGKEVKRRILIGTYVLSAGYFDAYYIKARRVQSLILQDFKNAFEKIDLILTPTAPTGPFAIGEEPKDPVSMYLNDIFTVTVNIAGLPGISIPSGLTKERTPLGLQLIAPHFREDLLISAGSVIEKCASFPYWRDE